ncbi:DUF72 domain-containing protein [Streptomyces sp. NPDC005908]|uniref:DUF72 domain-containing protein n=1 Tax=unclassified Streptomyces TaxID=2593676 RepID=UPI0011A60D2F|nr:DUF72 domain-containing protein [Streptomyces sp. T12]TWD19611.1 uncharacterized protein YecE (DUF72 family) [Streptomyces sp. T12]
MPLLVGTSGWQYKDWRGVLYPPGLPVRLWLEEYAASFATVEVNNAFYRLPSRETFESWRERTPPGFVVALKASRYLTHIKRLRDPEEPVERLMGRAAGLGDRLGPVLLQLPPTLQADPALLDACLRRFPASTRVAVEPRHPSWWTPEVRAVLEARGAALCWADVLSRPVTPLWRTTDWGYVRFHQGRAHPWPHYGRQALRTWLDRITTTWPANADVHTYFNNDPNAAAVHNARTLIGMTPPNRREEPRAQPPPPKGRGEPRAHPPPTRGDP